MKICWDNLQNIGFTVNGNFIKRCKTYSVTYIEKDSCSVCGEPYLTVKAKPSKFCSLSCSQSSSNNSVAGRKPHNWKGGVRELNLPLYDTYACKIDFVDEVKPYYDEEDRKLLVVRCSKCSAWFVPDIFNVRHRADALNGKISGEYRFYCSQRCKDKCEVYKKRPEFYMDFNVNTIQYTNEELSVWSHEILKRAKHKCEICGVKAEHAHHILPKKIEPGLALDPDNGVALCKACHYKYGHRDVCSTGKLSLLVCS